MKHDIVSSIYLKSLTQSADLVSHTRTVPSLLPLNKMVRREATP
jgi:hypothetical protein